MRKCVLQRPGGSAIERWRWGIPTGPVSSGGTMNGQGDFLDIDEFLSKLPALAGVEAKLNPETVMEEEFDQIEIAAFLAGFDRIVGPTGLVRESLVKQGLTARGWFLHYCLALAAPLDWKDSAK